MRDIELYALAGIVHKFCSEFITEINELKESVSKIGIEINRALPEPFKGKKPIEVQAFYSIDRKHIMIVFNKGAKDDFTLHTKTGTADPTGIFDFQGENYESSITGLTLQREDFKLKIGYALIVSYSVLIKHLDGIKDFVSDFVRLHREYYIHEKIKTKYDYILHLEEIKNKMSELFFDETVDELVIDKFLEVNPIIIEQGLNIIKPMHQVVLKNILGKYEHDLKPDLIAYDEREKVWAIVDYKKAKRNIIKNLDKVRTGFKAEVHALEDQLRDYVEYFDEREHRDHIIKENKIVIEYPKAIGIIGNVHANEQTAFNRLKQDQPKWFDVVPYNYLYDSFCRYLDLARKLMSN